MATEDNNARFDEAFGAAVEEIDKTEVEKEEPEDGGETRTLNEDLPIITLDTFEQPWAQDSRYVLTSPRSLEACSKYAIKPVDLLKKTLEDFYEEFPNVNRNVVHGMYEREERERQRRLRLVRGEREMLIEKEIRLQQVKQNFPEPELIVQGSSLEPPQTIEHSESRDASPVRKAHFSDDLPKTEDIEPETAIGSAPISDYQNDIFALDALKNRYREQLAQISTTHLDAKEELLHRKKSRVSSAPHSTKEPLFTKSKFAQNYEADRLSAISHGETTHLEAAARIRSREAKRRSEIEEKKLREHDRKKQQEIRKKALDGERSYSMSLMHNEFERKGQKVLMSKAEIERSEKLKRVVENAGRELKHLQNKKAMDEQLWNSMDIKKSYLEHKHDQAKDRYLQMQMKKEADIRKKVRADTVKADLVRRSMMLKEEETQKWRQMTAAKLAQDEERAYRFNESQKKQKQRKIHSELAQKEQIHKTTKQKIDAQNRKMKRLLESEINAKDTRAQIIKEEKDLTAQKRRELATLTKQTEDLSLQGRKNDFHEKALQAEITNNILFNYRKMAFKSK